MAFQGTGLSIAGSTARAGELYTGDGQGDLGSGGSPVSDFPTASVPTTAVIGSRMQAYYKNGIWRLAREITPPKVFYPSCLSDSVDAVFPVQATLVGIGPGVFLADRLLQSSKFNGKNVLLNFNASSGTFSNEWIVTAIDPPGNSLYSASFTQQRNARRRPNTNYAGKLVWQGRSNCLSGLSFENDFSNASWVKVAVTPSTVAGAAPGGANAQRLTETAVNSAHSVTHAFSTPTPAIGGFATPLVGTTVRYMGRFKTGTLATPRNLVYIEANGGTSRCFFDLNAGVVGTQTASTGIITALGGGWFMCEMEFVFASGDVRYGIATGVAGAEVISYLGVVTADLLCWKMNTNALAVRWFNDWDAHRTQWRIDVGIPNLPFFFWNLSSTPPTDAAGSYNENWTFFRTTVFPQVLADPFTLAVDPASGPFTDPAFNIQLAVGANPTEGQWFSGYAMADTILATIP